MKVKIEYSKYEGKQEEGLVEFYKDLGWDPGKQVVNPKKMNVSQKTWNELLKTLFPERTTQQGFFYMNYGPSVNETVKDQFIKLDSKWVIEG